MTKCVVRSRGVRRITLWERASAMPGPCRVSRPACKSLVYKSVVQSRAARGVIVCGRVGSVRGLFVGLLWVFRQSINALCKVADVDSRAKSKCVAVSCCEPRRLAYGNAIVHGRATRVAFGTAFRDFWQSN
jgi:hypothetical protein